MQYQTFSCADGQSQLADKLVTLRFPSLSGKRFLDIGCHDGYFCGYALFDGADTVVGIDDNPEHIARAQRQFPDAQFYNQSLDKLPDAAFDVIVCLSAVHDASDKESFIAEIMKKLAPDGVLIVELGLASSNKKKLDRTKLIEQSLLPTRSDLADILNHYAWKLVGRHSSQYSNPEKRVVHIRNYRPYVYLLLGKPGTGKTTITRRLFAESQTAVVSGDRCYSQLRRNKLPCHPRIQELLDQADSQGSIDYGQITQQICQQGLLSELVDLWCRQVGLKDFALDCYLPGSQRPLLIEMLFERGYFPVEFNWIKANALGVPSKSPERVKRYQAFLQDQPVTDNHLVAEVIPLMDKAWKKRLRWNIDKPAKGYLFSGQDKLRISGWAGWLDSTNQPLALLVQVGINQYQLPFNRKRPDVAKVLFPTGEHPSLFWQQNHCGFSGDIPLTNDKAPIMLNLVYEDQLVPFALINWQQPDTVSLPVSKLVKIQSNWIDVKTKVAKRLKRAFSYALPS
ncbi:methyltransferase domain-containing protein [Vibrio metschnikovii]|nr:methyltransferase domain-containing protein [Vibrio metschnikovii]